uniref:Transmembrane matrix receptor MUP-4 n=1 Tax=Parastrongyloides trichosuri TaxID=131310 RepID=A0A0N4ZF68_PARTI
MTSLIRGDYYIHIPMKILISLFILLTTINIVLTEESYKNNFKCWVSDPNSCDRNKKEICAFAEGIYMCSCPPGIRRNNDGVCTIFNECLKKSDNDCGDNSLCIDQEDGYTCQCNPGFVDLSSDAYRPGRICEKAVNECATPGLYKVDCHKNADCIDTDDSYQCKCRNGYEDLSSEYSKLPGRECIKMIDECSIGAHDCGVNALCVDQRNGYFCKCKPGYVDVSKDITNFPGRQCVQPMEEVTAAYNSYGTYNAQPSNNRNPPAPSPEVDSCNPLNPTCVGNRVCIKNTYGVHHCQCERGTVDDNGTCRIFNHCDRGNDCDPMAICSNEIDGYRCQCKPGFKDESVDPLTKPGRTCKRYINECAEKTHSCSPYADCYDLSSGYECKCKNGFVDVSSQFSLPPGRKCSAEGNECSSKDLNSCDENADCVQKADGYTCVCAKGYADVSASAKLLPGRVCTLQTTCPATPSDLTFIVDGSGSIGGDTFKEEVLRFLKEFVELFDIGKDQTRVGFIQYSDQIKHELDLGSHETRDSVSNAIHNTQYLTGLTRTGQAIEHVVENVYNDKTGNARPLNTGVSRIVIVITDGRSQDNVTIPAHLAVNKNINMFAVGVTDHVLDKELLEIANNKRDRVFKVTGFKELNSRLRSAIQKVACTGSVPEQTYAVGPCDPSNNKGCSGSLNQVCKLINGIGQCVCPEGFDKNPVTGVCGGQSCNPELYSTCPDPEVCKKTPYGNYLCTCPIFYGRDQRTGVCITPSPPKPKDEEKYKCDTSTCHGEGEECQIGKNGESICGCKKGFIRNPKSGKCLLEGSCDPKDENSCDVRKKEKCLPDLIRKGFFSCQCPPNAHRDTVTDICLLDECYSQDNTCSKNADCIDTLDGYICSCRAGFRDESPDKTNAPGRICTGFDNECLSGRHNCSVNAECIDTRDGFVCKCKDGFIDFSPNPRLFGGVDCRELIDECADEKLNSCHKDAICINTNNGYECKCKNGFVDRIPFTNVGKDCKKVNDLCESGKNNCDKNAKCIEVGENSYKCVCNGGFIDKSASGEKEGTKCLEQICHDKSKFDCHVSAICIESEEFPEKYTCKCRNGYVDENESRPGRQCKELINECLQSNLNDCDPVATCTDLPNGYTCQCPLETKDISTDLNKPGRKCFPLINECNIPQLNNCSRFADCIDTESSFECKCKSGYVDQNPTNPGTDCKFIINECSQSNLNDCSKHSECIDTDVGYTCKCKSPYEDVMPSNPGRKCLFNECLSKSTNDCDENAECVDTEDSYLCKCKDGYYDNTVDPTKAGRECLKFETKKPPQSEPQVTTPDPNLIPCGNGFCKINLGEVCIGGSTCGCKPDEDKNSQTGVCEKVNRNPITLRIVSKEDETGKPSDLRYSSEYGSKENPTYVEIVDSFVKGLGDTIQKTPSISPKYISSNVNYITNPKVENPDWDKGLLFNASVNTKEPVDKCTLFKEIEESIEQTNLHLGGGHLVVASDIGELNPCKPPPKPKGIPCGGNNFCKEELGEICIAGKVCGCPNGQKRKTIEDSCKPVEGINLPLWVAREGQVPIKYDNKVHGNPIDEENRRLTSKFEKGVGETFDAIPDLKNYFISSEVNDIENPMKVNESWDSGLLYNFTSYFTKGAVDTPKNIFSKMLEYIKTQNNYEVGKSNLFINPDTPNPFNPCYNAKCHTNAVCTPNGNSFICSCGKDFKDINPSTPGQTCVSLKNFNECERKEDNDCDVNARCIDLEDGYRCECKVPYVNDQQEGKKPGTSCKLDYCSDVNYCPLNSTCVNHKDEAVCECNKGFVDLKEEARKLEASGVTINKKYLLHGSEGDLVIAPVKDISIKESLPETSSNDKMCINIFDVNECALGLHDCSAAATCIDLKVGYTCKCNDKSIDGNPQNPGRICAELLCDKCHLHGDCIADSKTGNMTCVCAEGYTGEFCELSSASASTIFWIILALLFLLLTLLCCLYMCLKTRCFRGAAMSKSSLSGHEEILGGEDFYTIPRAKLKPTYGGMGESFNNADALERYLDGDEMSMSSGDSIIERKVITDVSIKETTTTRIQDENGEEHEETIVSYLPGHRTVEASSGEGMAHGGGSTITYKQTTANGGSHSYSHAAYEEDGDSENEYFDTEKVDKVTKHFNEHGRDDHGDFERFKKETSTKSIVEEKKFY